MAYQAHAIYKAAIDGEFRQVCNRDAEEAQTLDIPLVHYSTDYVFDGTKTGLYTENDVPNPLNVYGKTKLEGERAIHAAHDKYLILRTSWVYSTTRGKNFYRTMLKLFQEKDEVCVVDDQFGAPTSAQFLAEITAEVLSKIDTSNPEETRWGLYHLSGSETLSWYGFALNILRQVKEGPFEVKVKSIRPIAADQYGSVADRPKNRQLSCEKIQRAFFEI